MTGGTALPADTSQPPAPGPPQPGGQDELGSSGQPSTQEAGNRLPGLPRLFFPEQADQSSLPAGQPGQPSPPACQPYGQPASPAGQPYGQSQGQPGQRRNQPGGGMFQRQAEPRPARRRPSRQGPTQPPDRELRHRVIAALIFGLLSLVALPGIGLAGIGTNLHRGVYLLFFSAIVGVAACVIGITAVRKARRTGSFQPLVRIGAIGGIVLGTIAALISIPILATYLAFPTQVDNYVKCLSVAQSPSDQHACEQQFYRSIHLTSAPPH